MGWYETRCGRHDAHIVFDDEEWRQLCEIRKAEKRRGLDGRSVSNSSIVRKAIELLWQYTVKKESLIHPDVPRRTF